MEKLTPHDYQEVAIQQVLRDKHTLVKADVGSGKAQPLDSAVLTPQGFKRMGDMRVGDAVVTPQNRRATILGVYPQGTRPVYRVTLKDGSTTLADAEHLWTVKTQARRMHPHQVTTLELIEKLERGTGSSRPYIDLVQPLDFGGVWESIIPPYALGLLLGDGGFSTGTIYYSTADEYTLNYLRDVLPEGVDVVYASKYDYRLSTGKSSGKHGRNPWLNELRRLGLLGKTSKDKYIPKELLNSDKESRLALLQGLLDTDGSPMCRAESLATSTEFSSASKELADGVAFLARSLGASVYRRPKVVNGVEYQRLTIGAANGISLHKTPLKANKMKERTKYLKTHQAVAKVEFVGDMPTQCILVDSPEHEYVTDDFVRTHNTLVAVEAMLRAETKVNLIVGPINTFTGWAKTLKRQGGAVLQFIDGRKAGKEALERFVMAEPGYYFMGTERMRTMGYSDIHIDFFVMDECHRASNRQSKTFKVLRTVKPEYAVSLSATPWGGKVEGAWAVGKFLWPDGINNSFWKWSTEYLVEMYDPYSYKKFGGEKNPGSIIRDFPSVALMPSVYNAKPAIHEVEVDLNPTQRKHYAELEEDAITFLEDNPLIAELPSTKYIRLMETTLATPSIEWIEDEETGEDRPYVYFKDDAKSSKADAILEILADVQAEKAEPVLIFTHSRKFATFLTQRLQSKGVDARQFIGGMPHDERQWKLENFGKEFSVLVAVISAVAEGTDGMQDVCANEIWASVSDNKVLNQQARGRLSRQGQKRLVNRWVLRARGTIELDKQHPRLVADQQVLDESYGEASE